MNITGPQELNELDTLELNCTANTQANFTWVKLNDTGKSVIGLSSRSQITTIDLLGNISQSRLVIFNMSVSDSGKYICIAESVYNTFPANDSYRVNVTGILICMRLSLIKQFVTGDLYTLHAAINQCEISDLCQNNGNCTDLDLGYKCTCEPFFYGITCQTEGN